MPGTRIRAWHGAGGKTGWSEGWRAADAAREQGGRGSMVPTQNQETWPRAGLRLTCK